MRKAVHGGAPALRGDTHLGPALARRTWPEFRVLVSSVPNPLLASFVAQSFCDAQPCFVKIYQTSVIEDFWRSGCTFAILLPRVPLTSEKGTSPEN